MTNVHRLPNSMAARREAAAKTYARVKLAAISVITSTCTLAFLISVNILGFHIENLEEPAVWIAMCVISALMGFIVYVAWTIMAYKDYYQTGFRKGLAWLLADTRRMRWLIFMWNPVCAVVCGPIALYLRCRFGNWNWACCN